MRTIALIIGLMMVLGQAATAATAPAPAEETKQQISVLQSDAGHYEKALACRRLAAIGTPDCIPVLAGLLGDEKLGHMARFGLESNPEPAAGKALRDALGTLQGNLLVGAINSVGMRRDAEATAQLVKMAQGADAPVAAAAAAALGRIANAEAVKTLTAGLADADAARRAAVADSALTCAEQLLVQGKGAEAVALYDATFKTDLHIRQRQAALQGAILARGDAGAALLVEQLKGQDYALATISLRAARLLPPGPAVTGALTSALGSLPEEKQVLVIQALADRGDAGALAAITASARQGAAPVRLAAVKALGRLGGGAEVALLMEIAATSEGALAQAAIDSMTALPGKDANAAIVAAVEKGEPKSRMIAIDVADQRHVVEAVPTLLKAAGDSDPALRQTAIKALRWTLDADHFGDLVTVMVTAKDSKDRDLAQTSLASTCARIPQKDALAEKLLGPYMQAPTPIKCALLPLIAQVGGGKSLQALREATGEADTELRDAALRALCQRTNPDVLPDLARIAKTGPDQRFRILALQGQINLIPKLEATDEQKLAALRDAMGMVERKEEKQLALAALAQIPTAASLEMIEPFMGDPELKEEAAVAAVAIGEKIVRDNPAAVAKSLKLVKTENWHVDGQVKALLTRANRGSGAPAAQAGKAKTRGQGKGQGKDKAARKKKA